MSFPTPTIYTYRVVEVDPANKANGQNGYFTVEFSADSGSTWLPALGRPFGSLTEAYQAIAVLVNSETEFRNAYLHPNKFSVQAVVPTLTVHAYPPA